MIKHQAFKLKGRSGASFCTSPDLIILSIGEEYEVEHAILWFVPHMEFSYGI